jgi:hypothetical protein
MKPVHVGAFLEDERVKGLINGVGVIDPDYEHPKDLPPELSVEPDGSFDGETVIVSLGGSIITIMVDNAADYDYGSIKWFYGKDSWLGDTFTVDTGISPFNEKGTYQLMVEGTAGGKPYSTEIFIKVEGDDEE